MTTDRVLMTSGTSLVAAHCIASFLQADIAVRAIVPSLPRSADVREMVAATSADPEEGLGFVEADLAEPGWVSAIAGCNAVVHVEEEHVALDGTRTSGLPTTLRVLEAAAERGTDVLLLRRLDAEPLERQVPDDGKVTVIEHALPLGPALTPEHLDAVQPLPRMMSGRPGYLLPRRYRFIDVRDVAGQAVAALDPDADLPAPAAGGFVDPELEMLGLAPPPEAVTPVALTGPVVDPVNGRVRLPGWTMTERQLARPLRERLRRRTEEVPWMVAPAWWVSVKLRTASLLHRRSRLAPVGGDAVARPSRRRFPAADEVTRATHWRPTPQDVTIRDTIDSLVDLDEEARADMGGTVGLFSTLR